MDPDPNWICIHELSGSGSVFPIWIWIQTRAVDQHSFYADPDLDPAVFMIENPDPDQDPDPDPGPGKEKKL